MKNKNPLVAESGDYKKVFQMDVHVRGSDFASLKVGVLK
jgi:hypothetical protein